jgi:hypothetical protein
MSKVMENASTQRISKYKLIPDNTYLRGAASNFLRCLILGAAAATVAFVSGYCTRAF